tara:strand:- start:152 stop:547 length:396 start_codon:yes stop_codon:yes gene_type:complete
MKNLLLTTLLISITTLSANEVLFVNDSLSINLIKEAPASIEDRALLAIQTEDYTYIEKIISEGVLSPKAVVRGKPLIIHAAIHDKAEMILLLASYGAMIMDPVCEEGKSIMQYAKENNAIHAQAQIILIRA